MDVAKESLLDPAIHLLEKDARPSFIVSLADRQAWRIADMPVVHCNPALCRRSELETLIKKGQDAEHHFKTIHFRHWVTKIALENQDTGEAKLYDFEGFLWSVVQFFDAYLLVSGVSRSAINGASSGPTGVAYTSGYEIESHIVPKVLKTPASSQSASAQLPQSPSDFLPCSDEAFREDFDAFHSVDWSATSAGPISSWPQELRTACQMVLSCPRPAEVWLGDDLLIVHNVAARIIFPQISTICIGRSPREVMPNLWEVYKPIWLQVRDQRQTVNMENSITMVSTFNGPRALFLDVHLMPILDPTGRCLGVYGQFFDATKEVLSRRRLSTLLEISTVASGIVDVTAYWKALLPAMSVNKEDIGFAMLYSVEDLLLDDTGSVAANHRKRCTLEDTLGVEDAVTEAIGAFTLGDSTSYDPFHFERAIEQGIPTTHLVENDAVLAKLTAAIVCRAYSAPCSGVIVCPLRPTGSFTAVGLLILGLNAFVEYDEDYKQFVDIMIRQIGQSIASVCMLQEEKLRERVKTAEAALVHEQLQQRLVIKEQQLITSQASFERLADRMAVAMTISNSTGEIYYANKAFYDISGHTGETISAEMWLALIHPDDRSRVMEIFGNMWHVQEDATFEVRFAKEWEQELGTKIIRGPTWVLVNTYLEADQEQLERSRLVSCITDISMQKWLENDQHDRMLEALELKSRQEQFIDTISHEIRNPLSAVVQCADELLSSLNLWSASLSPTEVALRAALDAVETINLCCQHQRRVVDDVLMLSRLNSDMLSISTAATDPLELIRGAVKIFLAEARKHDIQLTYSYLPVRPSSSAPSDRYMIDSGRISQILVNLIGNAIKFTQSCPRREIEVEGRIMDTPPRSGDFGIHYVGSDKDETRAPNQTSETGDTMDDQQYYLHVLVRDSGIGMEDDVKRKLFNRFTQATPKTHVRYGGSGLGLSIAKQLCELQGGAIGLEMGNTVGTTFAFYVEAKLAPSDPLVTEKHPELTPVMREREEDSSVLIHSPSPSHISQLGRPRATVEDSQHAAGDENAPSSSSLHHLESISILVVEDNLINQRVLCRQLRQKGMTVHTANHGGECLDFLKTTDRWNIEKTTDGEKSNKNNNTSNSAIPLSIVLLDSEMPVMDGLECVTRIRQFEEEGMLEGHLPVLSVSANARDEQIDVMRKAGMDEHISKPFRIDELIGKIEVMLGKEVL